MIIKIILKVFSINSNVAGTVKPWCYLNHGVKLRIPHYSHGFVQKALERNVRCFYGSYTW